MPPAPESQPKNKGLVNFRRPAALADDVQLPSERTAIMAFFIFGAMTLGPWNCFLSAQQFLDQETFAGQNWALYSTQVYQTILLITTAATLVIRDRLGACGEYIIPCLVVIPTSIIFMFVATSTGNQTTRLVISLCMLPIFSFCGALFQSACMRVASQSISLYGRLPGQVMLGMAVVGMGTSAISLSFQPLSNKAAFIALFTALILLSLLSLSLSGVYRSLYAFAKAAALEPAAGPQEEMYQGSTSFVASIHGDVEEADVAQWTLARSALAGAVYEVGVFVVFVTTFIVFPATASRWQADGFIPSKFYITVVMSTFQVFDTVGRWFAELLPASWQLGSPIRLWCLILLRVAAVPFFFFCQGRTGLNPLPDSVFGHEIFQLVLMTFFALTNGLACSLAFMFAPQHVPGPARGIVGVVMTLALTAGIAVGSWLAMAE